MAGSSRQKRVGTAAVLARVRRMDRRLPIERRCWGNILNRDERLWQVCRRQRGVLQIPKE